MAQNIKIKSGDTPTIRLKVTNSSDVAVDITGYTSASIKIAKNMGISNTDALYYSSVLAAAFSDGANGIHDFVIPEDTTKAMTDGPYLCQTRSIDGSNVVTSTDIYNLEIEGNLIDDETS